MLNLVAGLVELIVWVILGISKLVGYVFFPETRKADVKEIRNSE